MKRTVSVQHAGERLGDLLAGVRERGDEIVIQQDGQTVGVLISPERYYQIESARKSIRQMLDELREHGSTTDPVAADQIALEVVQEVRSEQRTSRGNTDSRPRR